MLQDDSTVSGWKARTDESQKSFNDAAKATKRSTARVKSARSTRSSSNATWGRTGGIRSGSNTDNSRSRVGATVIDLIGDSPPPARSTNPFGLANRGQLNILLRAKSRIGSRLIPDFLLLILQLIIMR